MEKYSFISCHVDGRRNLTMSFDRMVDQTPPNFVFGINKKKSDTNLPSPTYTL